MLKNSIWLFVVFLAVWAGGMDWRFRRIPNWLTLSGLVLGLVVNALADGWPGIKASLSGAGLGLAVLLPFVLLRALGGGDWKLMGALGAFLGPERLIEVLIGSMLVAGVMALILIVYKGRVRQSLRNMVRMLGSLLILRLPGPEVSLDNPESAKVPFGVAVAITVVLLGVERVFVST
jgi:prepilin peptidase CpaA